jgi:hypothetical protein
MFKESTQVVGELSEKINKSISCQGNNPQDSP